MIDTPFCLSYISMASIRNCMFSSLCTSTSLSIFVCSSLLFFNLAVSQTWTDTLQSLPEIADRLHNDTDALQLAADDYGHIVHEIPVAVLYPSSIYDIAALINFSNSLPNPLPVAARGQGHSVRGQSMARNGIVINMTELGNYRNGSGVVISTNTPLGNYADVGGEQKWIDVLEATLEKGFTPLAWTDYLYLSVGGTLSNAGISGQALRFGPQISNVYELDVLTGTGELVTCSNQQNPELFFATLGGLGQFGIILRARIPLRPAPKRVKWIRLLYTDFSSFTRDQERLIGTDKAYAADYVEGQVLLNQIPLDLSFYPEADQQRVASLVSKYGVIYIMELATYYDDLSQYSLYKVYDSLLQGSKFVPGFKFEKDVLYEEFLNRVHTDEEKLASLGIWSQPHPWLNLLIPKSRIMDFNSGVFNGILLQQNLTAGIILIYPLDRSKWDARMSAVTPDEGIFYIVGILHTSGFENWEAFDAQNKEILQFCENAGIQIKQYLPMYNTQQEWAKHFGPKWKAFQERKARFDPKNILSPGQRIFSI